MPIHDWKRVNPGIFHHFHGKWIFSLADALNDGVLPRKYYALGEQVTANIGPDVLTLHAETGNGPIRKARFPQGAMAVTMAPPKMRITARAEVLQYAAKQNSLVIRHSSGDRIVAIVEILSSGNKAGVEPFRKLMKKVVNAIDQGIHLALIDLFPPTKRDPQGIHGAVWKRLTGEPYKRPRDKPLTVVSYAAGPYTTAYVEPCAVGDSLVASPLFLEEEAYLSLPLEKTYQQAYESVPKRWRSVLEGGGDK